MIPTVFYEVLFLSTFLLLPIFVYQASLIWYLLAILVLYISLNVIKQCRKTRIPVGHKSVLISGCDTGFGHALALRLHQGGFRVFAGCLLPDGQGATTLKEKYPDNLFVVPLDVTKDDSVKAAEKFVRVHLGDTCLWGYVNNAGVHGIGDIEVTSVQTYERVFAVNVFGMLRVTKAFLPLIRQAKGRVIVVSSLAALLRLPSFSCYGASKTAVECLSDCLRMEMRKFAVKVAIIEPGNFGAITNITAGENIHKNKHRHRYQTLRREEGWLINSLKRLYTEAEKSWDNSSEDVKQIYGRDHTRSVIDGLLAAHETSKAVNVDPVTDAIEESLLSSNPACRTAVHGDPTSSLLMKFRHLPEFIQDWVLCKGFGHSDTSNLQGLKHAMFLPKLDK